MEEKLSHVDKDGKTRMVDVSNKSDTDRLATARCIVELPEVVLAELEAVDIRTKKGPVFDTARLAGIMGVKKTSELIPLCHPLSLNRIDVDIELKGAAAVIDCTVGCSGKTGVEMEALTGASITALTIYDMCKALTHDIVIGPTQLIAKSGGKSDYVKETH